MRSRVLALFVLLVAGAVIACSGGRPAEEFTRDDNVQIQQFVKEFMAAYNAQDAEKLSNMYSGEAYLLPPNASTLRGFESIRGYYQNRFGVDGAKDLVLETRAVNGHGPLAYFLGTFALELQPPDGSPARRDRGKILWIMRRLANNWKIEVSMWSSDLPPPAPPTPQETDKASKK